MATTRQYFRMAKDGDDQEELSREQWMDYVGKNYKNAEELEESGDEAYTNFYIYWTESYEEED